MRKSCDSGIEIAKARLNLREGGFRLGFGHSVSLVVGHGSSRLFQRLFLVAQTGVGQCKLKGKTDTLGSDDEFGRRLD